MAIRLIAMLLSFSFFAFYVHSQGDKPDPRTYSQWAAFQIYNMGTEDVEIKNAELSWGKWYRYPHQSDDQNVSPPNGVVIKVGDTGPDTPFAASGRANSPSGTEGTFELHMGSTHVATIFFDCPYIGSNDLRKTFSCKNCVVDIPAFSKNGALGLLTIKVFKVPSLAEKA